MANQMEEIVREAWSGRANWKLRTVCCRCGEMRNCCGMKRKVVTCLECFDQRGMKY